MPPPLTDTPCPQMPEEEAFCVFVRLMQEYRLRELFKPSMAELGLCIYQFEYMLQVSRPRWSCPPTPPPLTLPATLTGAVLGPPRESLRLKIPGLRTHPDAPGQKGVLLPKGPWSTA